MSSIKMTFNNEEVIVKMDINPTSKEFLSLLPLTLKFEDYAGTEKISNLPKKLTKEDAPSGCDASVGDFTYYSPWGNLAIFYRDFGFASGLIKLGKIESGIEKLASKKGNFTGTIEKID
ncbi:cyclophilin-like fold protein [Fictibacillus sp. WQ 8-8]|uniref:cyclophilin-like fold protein n=1 Tax=Fictibacillus sp. WQ 8-8 TaxID=2938788 RepID=UPI00210CE66D|nr:cyclophilin-like fold protein [Fictibacillus sp. WQ 8-8]MCQ6268853.1 cyclophilin-like fold protein [Fictibacillus sp. WQ 8-8]